MNNLIKGLIKPGVYNLNAAIFTKTNEVPGQQGIWIRIKAGTTLVFSNKYDVNNNKLERDLDGLGSYVVKCVAETDEDYQLASPTITASAMFEQAAAGSGASAIPTAFVYAQFSYENDAAASVTPSFKIAAPTSNPDVGTNPLYKLPNEGMDASLISPEISYLLIGTILDSGLEGVSYAPYNVGSNWNTSNPAQDRWMSCHVFTARGLPEHRGVISKSYGQQLSSIIFSPQYNRTYLTSGQFYFNSTLYDISGQDWRSVYGQSSFTPIDTSPTTLTGMLTDHEISAVGETTYAPVAPTMTANSMIVEFLFMAVGSEYARSQTPNLAGIFNSNVSKKLLPFRINVTAPSGLDLDASQTYADYGFSTSLDVLPLDISINNIARLKSYLMNKNVLMPVIDAIRQSPQTSPFLDPTLGETLIPVLISFRQVNATGTGFTDEASVLTSPLFKKANNVVGASACNPANVLSFFELQSTSFAILGAALAAQEVFDTIPFLD